MRCGGPTPVRGWRRCSGAGADGPGLMMPAWRDLPPREEFAHSVMRGCSQGNLEAVLAECETQDGRPAPGMFLTKLPTLRLGGDGLCAFKRADGQVVSELTGVIVRAKPYRMLWHVNGEKMRPGCASPDSMVGIGDPGGECRGCPEKIYRGREVQYCRSKTRLYVVLANGESPTVIELTAMAREGLKGAFDYAKLHGVPHYQTVFTMGLKLHPRNRQDAGTNRATILTWQPVGPGAEHVRLCRVGGLRPAGVGDGGSGLGGGYRGDGRRHGRCGHGLSGGGGGAVAGAVGVAGGPGGAGGLCGYAGGAAVLVHGRGQH